MMQRDLQADGSSRVSAYHLTGVLTSSELRRPLLPSLPCRSFFGKTEKQSVQLFVRLSEKLSTNHLSAPLCSHSRRTLRLLTRFMREFSMQYHRNEEFHRSICVCVCSLFLLLLLLFIFYFLFYPLNTHHSRTTTRQTAAGS